MIISKLHATVLIFSFPFPFLLFFCNSCLGQEHFESIVPKDFALMISCKNTKNLEQLLQAASNKMEIGDFNRAHLLEMEGLEQSNEQTLVAKTQTSIQQLKKISSLSESMYFVIDKLEEGRLKWALVLKTPLEEQNALKDELVSFQNQSLPVLGKILELFDPSKNLLHKIGLESTEVKTAGKWTIFTNSKKYLTEISNLISKGGRKQLVGPRRAFSKLSQHFKRDSENLVFQTVIQPEFCRGFFYMKMTDEKWKEAKAKEISCIVGNVRLATDKKDRYLIADLKAFFTFPLSGLGLGYSHLKKLKDLPPVPFELTSAGCIAANFKEMRKLSVGARPASFSWEHCERTDQFCLLRYNNKHGNRSFLYCERIVEQKAMDEYLQMIIKAVNKNNPRVPYKKQDTGRFDLWAPNIEHINADRKRAVEKLKRERTKREKLGEFLPNSAYSYSDLKSYSEVTLRGYAINSSYFFQGSICDLTKVAKTKRSTRKKRTLLEYLKKYETLSGVHLDWSIFTFNSRSHLRFYTAVFRQMKNAKIPQEKAAEMVYRFCDDKDFEIPESIAKRKIALARCYFLRAVQETTCGNFHLTAKNKRNSLRIIKGVKLD